LGRVQQWYHDGGLKLGRGSDPGFNQSTSRTVRSAMARSFGADGDNVVATVGFAESAAGVLAASA